jgi:hypothetical protein
MFVPNQRSSSCQADTYLQEESSDSTCTSKHSTDLDGAGSASVLSRGRSVDTSAARSSCAGGIASAAGSRNRGVGSLARGVGRDAGGSATRSRGGVVRCRGRNCDGDDRGD